MMPPPPPDLIVHYFHLEKVNFAENVLNLTFKANPEKHFVLRCLESLNEINFIDKFLGNLTTKLNSKYFSLRKE